MIKESLPEKASPGGRVLCPNRCTVRADSISSISSSYDTLQSTWEEAVIVSQGSETKARIQVLSSKLTKFNYFYGCLLGELILRHTDNLSRTIHNKSMLEAEGQQVAQMTTHTFKSLRNDESLDLFWEKVTQRAMALDVDEPKLPRHCKQPRKYDDGLSTGDFHQTPKAHYRQCYFKAIDLIINSIQDRFNQPGYRMYNSLEILLIKACKQEELDDSLEAVCSFYKDDLTMTFCVHSFKHLVFMFNSSILAQQE